MDAPELIRDCFPEVEEDSPEWERLVCLLNAVDAFAVSRMDSRETVDGYAGGGLVRVQMRGFGDVADVSISEMLVQSPVTREALERLFVEAVAAGSVKLAHVISTEAAEEIAKAVASRGF